MRFASLGSGSSGNATLIEAGQGRGKTCVMLDCGFSIKQVIKRLERLGYQPSELSALLLTHEHSDHLGSALAFCKKFNIKIIMSWGTAMATKALDYTVNKEIDLMIIEPGVSFDLNSILISPFTVPHDAREPVQYIFSDGSKKLGILTDSGHITPHIEFILQGCTGLMIECNYDSLLLSSGPYPAKLKSRIAGDYGHLANDQAVRLLRKIYHNNLKTVVAAHLSEENNSPSYVRQALSKVLNIEQNEVLVADQMNGINWVSLD